MTLIKILFSFCLIICLDIQLLRAELSVDSLPSLDSTLLKQLEFELFPGNPEWIPIFEYPGCGEYYLQMDSSIFVRSKQPNRMHMQELLRQIAFSGEYSFYEPLMNMYQRHQENFKREWEYLHSQNKYGCHEKKQQISIMSSFEETLKALEWSQQEMTAEKLWENYASLRELDFNVSKSIGLYWDNIKKYKFYSEYYRDLRSMNYSWFGYHVTFIAVSPYIHKIESFVVEETKGFDPFRMWSVDATFEDERNTYYFIYNMYTINAVKSVKFEQVLMDRFQDFVDSKNLYIIHDYLYRNVHVSNEFKSFIVENFFSQSMFKNMDHENRFSWIRGIINDHTKDIILSSILKKAESTESIERELAFSYMLAFPEKQVLDVLIKNAKKKNISESEKEIIRTNLNAFNYRNYFSKRELRRISATLQTLQKDLD